jgi:hypothetical protein
MEDTMDFVPFLIGGIFVIVIGKFLHGRVRYGSWTGSFLKGNIERTVGEVRLESPMATSQTLKVHAMKAAGNEPDFVAMVLISKAPLGASMQPIKLTKSQAGELAVLLQDAAR